MQSPYTAIGQYLVYRAMLIEMNMTHSLYLCIPTLIFEELFDTSVIHVIRDSRIKIVVVDLASEKVTQWIE